MPLAPTDYTYQPDVGLLRAPPRYSGAILVPGNTGIEQTLPSFSASLVRSSTSQFATKVYFETTVNVAAAVGQVGAGIDNNAENLTGPAGQAGSVCWCGDGSVNYNGNLAVYRASTFAVGDVLGVAVDLQNFLIWFRDNGGNWNASGSANPSTATGGFSIAAVTGLVFALAQLSQGGDEMTADFSGPFAFSIPAGFQAWSPTPAATGIVGVVGLASVEW
jgi:hypothetical protein